VSGKCHDVEEKKMTCLMAIAHSRDLFSPVEKKIADFILANPEKIRELSSLELAKLLDVSQSGIVKFAQKLGYKGFPAFKLSISEAVGRNKQIGTTAAVNLHNAITGDDSLLEIAEKLLLEKQNALRETTNALVPETLSQVIQCIHSAGKVQIAGIGGSALTAKDLAYKLLKIGIHAFSEIDGHVQLSMAQTLGVGDVLLAISYTGTRREIILAAEVAKKNGATLIVISSLRHNKLAAMADYLLHSVADESRWRSSSISSRTAQNALTDLIFMGLVQKDQRRASELIQNTRELMNKLIDS
jgi:RpiR family murPQ operon transcriptional repressor